MGKHEVDIEMKIFSIGADLYRVAYPTVLFPKRCIVCGKIDAPVFQQTVTHNKLMSRKINGAVRTEKKLPISLKLNVPICSEEKQNIEKSSKRMFVGLAIMAALGVVLSIVLFSKDIFLASKTDLTPVLGFCIGGLLVGAAFMAIFDFAANLAKRPKVFFNKPYSIEILDNNISPSVRLHIMIRNDEVFSEFKKLNQNVITNYY